MTKVLVTGGAGYIGSFIVRNLKENGYEPVIVDDMSSGHEAAVEGFKLYKFNIADGTEEISKVLKEESIEAVIHMASFIQMGESFRDPGKYFRHNLTTAINLFDAMVENNVGNIVFSSSAGVFGTPEKLPIEEDAPKRPENPYGETKLMIERMLHWYDEAHSIKSISIRYFNAAGAAFDGSIGEAHPNESHIIPLIMNAALRQAQGQDSEFTLFGNDYKTVDGTCVRDYVHVLDLAEAHSLALKALFDGAGSTAYNAGVGRGYSNLEIVNEIEKQAGKFNWKFGPRRLGDADALYAANDKIKRELGWEPKYGLEEIIASALAWHKSHPNGYNG